MKSLRNYFLVVAIAVLPLGFFGCDKGDDPQPQPPVEEGNIVKGDITQDLTLKSGGTYILNGGVHVKEGVTLTIEEGVRVKADASSLSYLLIEQGGKIMAQGTASQPIIFTSSSAAPKPGDWGGIMVCGKARINVTGATGISEVGNAVYGGNDDADNSGVIKYVRLEYTGYAFDDEHESNGFALYGVGSGTTLDYLQAYKGADDGFEFFGGTVNASHLVSTGNQDDSYDWTEGWRGTGQFWVAHQSADADRGIEADNLEGAHDAGPFSNPTLSNVTLVGNGKNQAMELRRGTKGYFYNFLIKGYDVGVDVDDDQTILNLNDGSLDMEYAVVEARMPFKYSPESEGAEVVEGCELNADGANVSKGFTRLDGIVGTLPGGKNVIGQNGFLKSTTFKGAVPSDNDWTQGWIHDLEQGGPSENIVSGDITSNLTLESGNDYVLQGGVQVKEGATLTIEEGVTIKADASQLSYLLVEKGGKIMAEGTANQPIVFTSNASNSRPGDWGGIMVCGKATINVTGGTGTSEIGNALYGGEEDGDNSGVMRYVRVEYSGFAFDETHESNSFALYAVGSGTTLEYLQSYQGADDGFEFFGGTVNAKYLVSTASQDDSFDWTEGWRGKGQFWVAYQTADADRGIEADNLEGAHDAAPFSNPTLANITLVGNGTNQAMELRRGTKGAFYNIVVSNYKTGIDIDDDQTIDNLDAGDLVVDYSVVDVIDGGTAFKYSPESAGKVSATKIEASANAGEASVTLSNGFVGIVSGGTDLSADSYFTATDFKGAVSSDNEWTALWTNRLN